MWMLHIGLKDVIDILLVAAFLYAVYRLMKKSGKLPIFSGIIAFVAIWILISRVFEMRLMGAILDKFVSVGMLALVILFQDEIRRFLATIGSHPGWERILNFFRIKIKGGGEEEKNKYVTPVTMACEYLARRKTGALIVISRTTPLDAYAHNGEMFKAEVNARLIENIFFKDSPLHDGALIISDNAIIAAACVLPLAPGEMPKKEFGLRHRSAIGLSEVTDAIIIVVSEQRGSISVAQNGKIAVDIQSKDLGHILTGDKKVDDYPYCEMQ
ncbi:MAG: diadenylate cyclase CdaA [Tannerella sp.]|jgi:uncharacterized protein (TIGR00159 family)|nr:diadenylate cyclase CdaA [Tannerella sp.]